MLTLTKDERELVEAVLAKTTYKTRKEAAVASNVRDKLGLYTASTSVRVDTCGCEVLSKDGELTLSRCTLHENGIEAFKLLADIVAAGETEGEIIDTIRTYLDEVLELPNEASDNRDYVEEVLTIVKGMGGIDGY